jgi:hypothetical protein
MEITEIQEFKKSVRDLIQRHLSGAEEYLNPSAISKELVEWADYDPQQIPRDLKQRGMCVEAYAMETIVRLTRGKIRMGVFNGPSGQPSLAGQRLLRMIEDILKEGEQKGYWGKQNTMGESPKGCLGLFLFASIIPLSGFACCLYGAFSS